ncbi:MAG: 2-dehydro-3-deoxygalactonokinase, partial [Bacteroidota bacterium]
MEKFISCDWGTSSLRLRLVDADTMSVLAEVTSSQGILGIYDLWKQNNKEERISFYQSILADQIKVLEGQINSSLQDMPLIISGMACSSIGMLELPYKEIPFSTDGKDLIIKIIEATNDFKHKILIISGAKTEEDAMRGEETQLIGCLNDDYGEDMFIIFPGTHSKHITIKHGKVVDVKTYMTGEFFELLSKKSILSNNVEENHDPLSSGNLNSFEKAVADSLDSNILHSSFMVRINQLFGKLSKQENFSYLSGLLIGTELKEIIKNNIPLTIVGEELLIKLYSTALQKLGISNIKYHDAGKAIMKGHGK